MQREVLQSQGKQHTENDNTGAVLSASKRKRLRSLIPELRAQVPALFDHLPAEKVAEQFGVPAYDVLEEVIRDLRRRALRGDPSARGLAIVSRRTA